MKPIRKSVTVWINFSVLMLLMFDEQFFSTIHIEPVLAGVIVAWIAKIVAILNIALRVFWTEHGLEHPFRSDK